MTTGRPVARSSRSRTDRLAGWLVVAALSAASAWAPSAARASGLAHGAEPPDDPGAVAVAQRDPPRLELICDEIGRVEVVVDGDLAAGGRARIADAGPLALSGEPGFSGLSGAGHPISISTEAAQPNCRSPRRETVDLTRLVAIQGGERAAYVTAVGVLSWTIVVTGSPVQRAITATRTFPFESALQAYLASRPGDVTVAVAVRGRAEVFGYTRGQRATTRRASSRSRSWRRSWTARDGKRVS